MFLNNGEEVKGTLGIPVVTMPDGPIVFEGADGLATRELVDTEVDELKFKDSTSAIDTLGLGALTSEGDNPLTIMDEVGVDISPIPSPDLDITKLKGTLIPGGLNGRTYTKT